MYTLALEGARVQFSKTVWRLRLKALLCNDLCLYLRSLMREAVLVKLHHKDPFGCLGFSNQPINRNETWRKAALSFPLDVPGFSSIWKTEDRQQELAHANANIPEGVGSCRKHGDISDPQVGGRHKKWNRALRTRHAHTHTHTHLETRRGSASHLTPVWVYLRTTRRWNGFVAANLLCLRRYLVSEVSFTG